VSKFLLIVELFSYIVNLLTRTSRQQELSSREKQNTSEPIDRFAAKFGKPSVPVENRTAKDTAGLQQADPIHDRPK
jgi:hypothetical protein